MAEQSDSSRTWVTIEEPDVILVVTPVDDGDAKLAEAKEGRGR